ncbi:MAG: DUF58 domain-containing protein [Salinirussus sp.]
MRLSRRGWALLAVVIVGVVLAQLFGQPGLNAVVAPAAVALVAGLVQVFRATEPTVTVEGPRAGFPDETRSLSVAVEGGGLVGVSLTLPDGLAGADIDATVTPPHAFEREVRLVRRGIHAIDPPAVDQRGPLGLVRDEVPTAGRTETVVYPRRYAVAGSGVATLFAADSIEERQEFDRLREYVPGDPLRNVHWKSSAKHDEYLVMEFAPARRDETVSIAAEATEGNADGMASAAATVAELAFDADLSVGLTLPGESLSPGAGGDHRESLLRLLAAADSGSVPDPAREAADVAIEATDAGTQVRTAEEAYDFDAVTTTRKTVAGVNA